MNEKYEFVYSLIYQDRVFYVGRCKDLLKRYRWHLNAPGTAKSAQYIRWIISQGHYPDINIIDWIPEKEAIKREAQIILDFSVAGHTLTNHIFTRTPHYDIKNRPAKPTPKDMYKIAKYKQLNYVALCILRYRHMQGLEPLPYNHIPNPFN